MEMPISHRFHSKISEKGIVKMLVTPPFGASSNIALWRAYSKPPVELVVADSFLWLRMECDVVRISAIFEKSTLGMDKSPVFWERNLISSGLCLD